MFMKHRWREHCRRAVTHLGLVAGLILLAAPPAWGTTLFHEVDTTSSPFTAEAGNQGILLGAPLVFYALPSSDVGGTGVSFTPLGGGEVLSGTSLQASGSGTGSGFTITIANPLAAFGFEFTSTGSMNYCVDYSDGSGCQNSNTFLNATDTPFFGWVADAPFTGTVTITKTGYNGSIQINQFQVGNLSAPLATAPEPGTMLLMGSSLIMFPLLSRRILGKRK